MISESRYFDIIKTYELLAKKNKDVGQNFLIDPSVAKAIVGLLEAKEGERVLEIGCGAGSLSYFLAQGPAESDLIDIDEGLLTKLKQDFEDNPYVHPMRGNAMRFDYSSYDKIVGNLPYYITSGIVERVLLGANKAKRIVFMVQKEAAQRLLAKPKTADYSPLTIYLNYVCRVTKALSVPHTSFVPAPHVDSTVLLLEVDQAKHNEEAAGVYALAKALFLNRRKTIQNNLRAYLGSSESASFILSSCKIDPKARPEELLAEDYLSLYRESKREKALC